MTKDPPADPLVDIGVEETVGSPEKPRRIYAYTVPGKDAEPWTRTVGSHEISGVGLVKVGETTRGSARERITEQLGTAYPGLLGIPIFLDEPARRVDGSYFRDRDVHRELETQGIKRPGGEWFECTVEEVKAAIVAVRNGKPFKSSRTNDWPMRPEQEKAVAVTAAY